MPIHPDKWSVWSRVYSAQILYTGWWCMVVSWILFQVIGHLAGQTARLVVLLGMILHDKVRVSKMYDTISTAIQNARTELDRCKERIQHSTTLGDSKAETSDGVILDQNGVLMTLHSALGVFWVSFVGLIIPLESWWFNIRRNGHLFSNAYEISLFQMAKLF